MTAFPLPDGVPEVCESTAPDLWTVGCQLERGHAGLHRNNGVVWNDPLIVYVGGQEPDVNADSDHWVDGQVVFTHEQEPDL